jgi:hypothetical protein
MHGLFEFKAIAVNVSQSHIDGFDDATAEVAADGKQM